MYDVTMTEHRPDDWTPRTRAAVRLVLVALLAAYLVLGLVAVIAPTPWSPLGQVRDEAPAPTAPALPEDVRQA